MKQYHFFDAVEIVTSMEGGLLLQGEKGEAELLFVAPGVLRVDYNPNGHDDLSWAVIANPVFSPVTKVSSSTGTTLSDGLLQVEVHHHPFALAFSYHEGRTLCRSSAGETLGHLGSTVTARMDMRADDHYYGFGEKMGPMDKRGKAMSMWNTDVVPHLPHTDPLYMSIPFFIGFNNGAAWGVFLDNTYRSHFDLGSTDSKTLSFGAEGGRLRYYLLAGPSIADILLRYSELTGKMPMPPKWSLGYQQCRYSYHPDSQVLEMARLMRQKEIPCDAFYLDIHYMDGYRVFTFDPQEFSDPKGLTMQLQDMGFKTVCLVDPGVKVDHRYDVFLEGIAAGHFATNPNGEVYVGNVWPGPTAFPDFLKADVRHWWGEWHRFYVEQGIAGIWNDMNEPAVFNGLGKTMPEDVRHGENGCFSHARVHNVYALEMAKATREGLLRQKPNERPFILTRAGFAGIQRYSAVWMGDNSSWWEHLAAVIPMSLGMGLSGVVFVGTDIGGFVDDCQPELLARWTQLGAFAPFCRNHAAIDTIYQEPWAFGEDIEAICRNFIRLRYQLMPLIYTLFYEASATGLPLWRPLVLHYPHDKNTWRLDDQCLLGSSLLLAPVVAPGRDKRLVYLPEGMWYDWWTNEKHTGGTHIIAEAPLEIMPLFVKAGAIIPMAPVVNYHGEKVEDTITIEVFAHENLTCHGELYYDDGISLAFTRGQYKHWRFTLDFEPEMAHFKVVEAGEGPSPYKNITLRLRGLPCPLSLACSRGDLLSWQYVDDILSISLSKFADLAFTWSSHLP